MHISEVIEDQGAPLSNLAAGCRRYAATDHSACNGQTNIYNDQLPAAVQTRMLAERSLSVESTGAREPVHTAFLMTSEACSVTLEGAHVPSL